MAASRKGNKSEATEILKTLLTVEKIRALEFVKACKKDKLASPKDRHKLLPLRS